MKSFVQLQLEDQAAVVLLTLLEDVVHNRRSFASVEHSVGDLFSLLADSYDIPIAEARQVANAVARHGIRMLPGYTEDGNGNGNEELGVDEPSNPGNAPITI